MNSIYEWLDKACKPLRYKPDHEAAYKELKDHYEDHRLYLLDQGAYPGVAERQALEAMGIRAAEFCKLPYPPMSDPTLEGRLRDFAKSLKGGTPNG